MRGSELDVGPSDAELVAALRGGDGTALSALYDRYAKRVYNHCFRRTASWDATEDATATVFLEAWKSRHRAFVHDERALPWLLGIATNVCRGAHRSQQRHLKAVQRLAVEPIATPEDLARDRLAAEQQMARVLRAQDSLSQADQEIVALVLGSGCTYEDAAAALGVPVGTVRSRLHRAKQRLRNAVHSDGGAS